MPRDPAKLAVFHRAHQLALAVYKLTRTLPVSERFGLQTQLRRGVVSIPANIVEGCARDSAREYRRFLDVAVGSAVEVRYLLRLAVDLELLDGVESSKCRECADHVVRELHNLCKAVGQFEA